MITKNNSTKADLDQDNYYIVKVKNSIYESMSIRALADEQIIICGKLESRKVKYTQVCQFGILEETGLPEEKAVETIEIAGVKYDKSEVENRLKDIKPVE